MSAPRTPLEPLLAELVRLASPTSDAVATAAVLEVVAAHLGPLGFVGGLVPGATGPRRHLLMRRPAAGPASDAARRVLLLGHADTVHERHAGFDGYWRDGELGRGPGVADAKGGLAVLVGALERLPAALPAELVVFVSSDEEDNGETSRALIAEAARGAALCLDFEPARPDGALVRGRRGVGRYKVTATGRMAHAGQAHHDGRNAILPLALAVPKIESLTDPVRGVTVSCGIIRGGTRINVVPAHAELFVDARADDAVGAEWVDDRLHSIALANPVADTTLTVDGGFSTPPWATSAATDALVRHWQQTARELGLEPPSAVVSGGGSDANQVQALGVPTLDGLGAVGGDYHSEREWVMVSSLEPRAALHAAALARWLGVDAA